MCAKARVVVAMSGGVDSSLTAALLLRQGYDVIGITMQLWDNEESENLELGSRPSAAVDDARRVADRLGIPHYFLDFRDLFRQKVVNYFLAEYEAGRTPNPCIACNRYVKFGELWQKAQALGAQFLATGHYARVIYDSGRGRYLLRQGIDFVKDQSYFLYHLKQEILAHLIMPLGDYTKKQTRQLAREMGLTVADKPDSQEICFIPNKDYKGFIAKHSPASLRPENIVDTQGHVVGRHKGLPLYTVGQRKGLGIAAGKPLYVVALNPMRNEVVVGSNVEVLGDELVAGNLTFISSDTLTSDMPVKAKIRYNAAPADAVITPLNNGQVRVKFATPQRAITPGQAVVFYEGDVVVGGGTILWPGH